MRSSFLLTVATCFAVVVSLTTSPSARAQVAFASNVAYGSRAVGGHGAATEAAGTKVFSGKVVSPAGALPGAVVKVAGSKEMAVTNASGEFSLQLPASMGAVQLTASYAGFADETVAVSSSDADTTLKLATPCLIKVARKQQLKAYLKTAHRQAKRSLRHLN